MFGEFSERFGFDGKLEDLFALFHQEKPTAWTTTTTTSAPMTTQQVNYKREICDDYLRTLSKYHFVEFQTSLFKSESCTVRGEKSTSITTLSSLLISMSNTLSDT